MDYESLIADLQKISQMNSISHYKRDVCAAAATALSTLQIENQALRNAANGFKAENEKLRADLARVTAERDAAQALLAEISGAIGSAPITATHGVPLERIRELVEADREQEFQRYLKRFDIMPPKKNALKAREQDGNTE